MLFATQPPVELVGTAEIENLQLALRGYAEAARFPAAHPGAIDGVADYRLVRAINAVGGPLLAQMDVHGTVKATLRHVLSAATRDSGLLPQALQYINLYVNQLIGSLRRLASKARSVNGQGRMPVSNRATPISPLTEQSAAMAARAGDVATRSSVPAYAAAARAARGLSGLGQDEVPWYKKWQTWVIGGGVAALAVGGYMVARR